MMENRIGSIGRDGSYCPPPTGLARSTDPETSRMAAVRFLAGARRETAHVKIMRAMMGLSAPATASEIAALCRVRTAHKRTPELERKGLIRRADARKCRISGEMATTWEVT